MKEGSGWGYWWNKIGDEFIIVEVGAGDMEAYYTIISVFYKIFQNKYAS